MLLREYCKEELKRSPITVIATVVGVIVGALALVVGWLQYIGSPASAPTAAATTQPGPLRLSNLLVVFAFFLAFSLSLASSVRMLARVHSFGALIVSILAAVLAGFGTMVMLALVPPRSLTAHDWVNAENVVSWGVAIIFVSINGLPVLQDFARPVERKVGQPSDGADGIGVLALGVIFLFAWYGFVAAGISKLVRLFLG